MATISETLLSKLANQDLLALQSALDSPVDRKISHYVVAFVAVYLVPIFVPGSGYPNSDDLFEPVFLIRNLQTKR